ncbi:MAG: DUF6364 family protein [Mucilaginibacter sp.]
MKTRINLTIDDKLLTNTKAYAQKKHTSVSELVENYLKVITRPAKKVNIIDMVEKLGQPNIDQQADLKELFYKDQAEKYGF